MATFPQVGESFGSYEVLSRLGQGGMGVVFRARQLPLSREVALKVLSPQNADVEEFRTRFTREAGLLAAVNSPHIVAIHDFGEINGCLYIATQLVAGSDLGARLAASGPLPLPVALTMAAQIASALAEAHRSGVVHRDVKPTNVLLDQRDGAPHAYLCDFGIARATDSSVTQTGVVIGTYAYLSPEQLNGEPATPASDIYALGCLLVAAVTGAAPYQGTDLHVSQQHLNAPVPQWQETTSQFVALNRIVRTAMAKDPAQRYPTADDFRRELLAAATTSASVSPVAQERADMVGATPPPPPPQERPVAGISTLPPLPPMPAPVPAHVPPPAPVLYAAPPRRSATPVLVGVAALVVIALAVGIGVLLTQGKSNAPQATPRSPTTTNTATGGPTPENTSTPDGGDTAAPSQGRCAGVVGTFDVGESCPAPTDNVDEDPTDATGLHYVFPHLRKHCTSNRSAEKSQRAVNDWHAFRQCDQSDLVSGRTVRVTYVEYNSATDQADFLAYTFGTADGAFYSNGIRKYGPAVFRSHGHTGTEIGLAYEPSTGYTFGVSITCGQESVCRQAIDQITMLDPDEIAARAAE